MHIEEGCTASSTDLKDQYGSWLRAETGKRSWGSAWWSAAQSQGSRNQFQQPAKPKADKNGSRDAGTTAFTNIAKSSIGKLHPEGTRQSDTTGGKNMTAGNGEHIHNEAAWPFKETGTERELFHENSKISKSQADPLSGVFVSGPSTKLGAKGLVGRGEIQQTGTSKQAQSQSLLAKINPGRFRSLQARA